MIQALSEHKVSDKRLILIHKDKDMKFIIYIVSAIFMLTPLTTLAETTHPIEKLTFLINYWQADNPYYHNLQLGLDKLKEKGFVKHIDIVSYDNDAQQLVQKFDTTLPSSDAIVMAMVVEQEYSDLAKDFAEKAQKKNIPLIFITRRPSLRVLDEYPNVYYVNPDNISAGLQQGLIISHYLEKHPETDKNQDGQINILNVVGDLSQHGSGHERIQWQLNTVNNYPGNHFRGKEILAWPADYSYQKAKEYTEKGISDGTLDNVEVIATQSDLMAKAVADVLTDKGIKIPIFGRDGDKEIIPYLKDGRIAGTISSPLKEVTYYAGIIAYNLTNQLDPNTDIPYSLYNKQLDLPYIVIDASNVNSQGN